MDIDILIGFYKKGYLQGVSDDQSTKGISIEKRIDELKKELEWAFSELSDGKQKINNK